MKKPAVPTARPLHVAILRVLVGSTGTRTKRVATSGRSTASNSKLHGVFGVMQLAFFVFFSKTHGFGAQILHTSRRCVVAPCIGLPFVRGRDSRSGPRLGDAPRPSPSSPEVRNAPLEGRTGAMKASRSQRRRMARASMETMRGAPKASFS